MTRVNITVPDDIVVQAKAAGLNVSRLATAALVEELDRRAKIDALETYLAELEHELGPITPDEQAAAAAWAETNVASPASTRPGVARRRSA